MSKIDIIILIPLIIGALFGLFRGLIKELVIILILFIGIFGSKWISPVFSSMLTGVFKVSNEVAVPLSFLLVLVVLLILGFLISRLFENIANAASLGFLNKLLGAAFGALKMAIIVSLILTALQHMDSHVRVFEPDDVSDSKLYSPVFNLTPDLWEVINERATEE